ncbi:anti-sigma regulatory factor [Allochromatium vinosum]|uniref:Anti-sigma regulatory factor, serine/threonine protein kinase n=1 Tax=Allochromatium vinosum (strain ATCC 17899 / DSM 180 / NBRC 103801 / NCIMB 10441 / D) TaxID=572477 RepID=D3RNM3_ALLVD|nr:anti-sigma regulatory factor [Allochromatium vinosum]ADC63388.1 putative anti-sigma regulatory factor, serine/threonine protein kinase [Allochromatium vinosum DSM 180]MBK1654043.1 anti-sigma regulatory factor [Allochromatium vinosum]
MSEPLDPECLPIRSTLDIVTARHAARALCERLGFGKADQTRLATAVSELARNVIQYAGEGSCLIEDVSDARARRIRVLIQDQGPGIPNLDLALTDGYSTSGGLGAGLPGTRRLTDEFQIESMPGSTRVTIALVKPR